MKKADVIYCYGFSLESPGRILLSTDALKMLDHIIVLNLEWIYTVVSWKIPSFLADSATIASPA